MTSSKWYWAHGSTGDLAIVLSAYADSKAGSVSIYRGRELVAFGPTEIKTLPGDVLDITVNTSFSGTYHFTFTPTVTIPREAGLLVGYSRWVGRIKGGLVGGDDKEGPIIWELMTAL